MVPYYSLHCKHQAAVHNLFAGNVFYLSRVFSLFPSNIVLLRFCRAWCSSNGVIKCYLNYLKPGIKGLSSECWQAFKCSLGKVLYPFLCVYTLKIIWKSTVNYSQNVCTERMNNSFTSCSPKEWVTIKNTAAIYIQ